MVTVLVGKLNILFVKRIAGAMELTVEHLEWFNLHHRQIIGGRYDHNARSKCIELIVFCNCRVISECFIDIPVVM